MPTYQVYIRQGSNYAIIDQIDDWISLKAIKRFNGIGTFEIIVRANSVIAPLLVRTNGIVIDRDGAFVFSGQCTQLTRTVQTITMRGEDDNRLLRALARPTPSQATGAFADEYDIRTGVASTVMIELVHDNIGQTAPTSPINWRIAQLTTPDDPPTLGGTITSRARFDRLIDLLADLAVSPVAGGLGFQILQSDAFVQNIEFTVYEPRDQTAAVTFSTDLETAQDYEDIWQAPEHNYFYAMLGDGLGVSRTVLEAGNDTAIGEMGFRSGGVLDVRAVSGSSEGTQKLNEAVAGATPTRRVKVTPVDVLSLNYGTDWDLGDIVTVAIDGVTYEQVIREVEIQLIPEQGVRVLPTVGDAGTSNDSRVGQHIASVVSRVAYLEANYRLPASTIESLTPIGAIILWPSATTPDGWIRCDGGSHSTTTQAALFAIIGYAFGGSGSSFNVPNLSGRVPIGVGSSYPLAQTGGSETIDTAHTHPGSVTGVVAEAGGGNQQDLDTTVNLTHGGSDKVARQLHTHGATIASDGGSESVVQPYLSLYYIIRAR